MQNTEKSQYNRNNDETDLLELFKVVVKGRWIIGSLTTFTTIVALCYSLSLPNIYQSSALLNPLESQDTMSGALKGYGGIASLAGINLPAFFLHFFPF